MALTKMGGVTTAASGKMNGIVYSHNRNGTYVRTFAVPTNPRSAKQTAVRNALAGHSAQYRGLTEAQQADWANLGQQITRTNRVGDVYNLTGSQAFVSINQLRSTAGQAVVTDAPSPDALLLITNATAVVTAGDDTGDRIMQVIPTLSNVPVGAQLRIYATAPVSAGKRFLRPTQFRLLSTVAAVTTTPISILAAWEATFGNLTLSKAGSLIGISLVPYDPEGFAGTEFRILSIAEEI